MENIEYAEFAGYTDLQVIDPRSNREPNEIVVFKPASSKKPSEPVHKLNHPWNDTVTSLTPPDALPDVETLKRSIENASQRERLSNGFLVANAVVSAGVWAFFQDLRTSALIAVGALVLRIVYDVQLDFRGVPESDSLKEKHKIALNRNN